MQIFAGVLWRGASNDSEVIENVDFHGFWTLRLRHLRKWGQRYYIVLFSPVAFPVTPKYMTLNDFNGLFCVKFCFCAGLACWDGATSENKIVWKLIKIDACCQWCISSARTLVSDDIRFVRIFLGAPRRGGIKRQWGNEKRWFSRLVDATSSTP